MNKRRLIDELASEIKLKIDAGEDVLFTVTGISMQPLLYNGRDIVVLSKPEFPLKKHQIAFYHYQNNVWLLHRVLKVNKDSTYDCRGDNRWIYEVNIKEDQIIGIVKGFYRNGKYVDVNKSISYFFYCKIWPLIHCFKPCYKYFFRAKQGLIDLFDNIFNPKVLKFVSEDGRLKSIIFRKAKNSDVDQLIKLHIAFGSFESSQLCVNNYDTEWFYTEKGRTYIKDLIKKSYVNVAEHNGKLVGYCRGGIVNTEAQNYPIGRLSNVFVLSEYRKYGIGSEFIKQFKEYCKENMCESINVTFYCNNEEARRFYKKHGFSCYKETQSCTLR